MTNNTSSKRRILRKKLKGADKRVQCGEDLTCRTCQESFVDRRLLAQHQKDHLAKDIDCQYPNCKKSVSAQQDLRKHVLEKHDPPGMKPWKCKFCNARYTRKSATIKHCAKNHKSQWKLFIHGKEKKEYEHCTHYLTPDNKRFKPSTRLKTAKKNRKTKTINIDCSSSESDSIVSDNDTTETDNDSDSDSENDVVLSEAGNGSNGKQEEVQVEGQGKREEEERDVKEIEGEQEQQDNDIDIDKADDANRGVNDKDAKGENDENDEIVPNKGSNEQKNKQ